MDIWFWLSLIVSLPAMIAQPSLMICWGVFAIVYALVRHREQA